MPIDEVQIAGFHPAWAFGGVPDDDPLHFEKRAPHPTVSLVLVDGLEHANSAKIAADNERTLAALGVDAVARAFAGFVSSDESVLWLYSRRADARRATCVGGVHATPSQYAPYARCLVRERRARRWI